MVRDASNATREYVKAQRAHLDGPESGLIAAGTLTFAHGSLDPAADFLGDAFAVHTTAADGPTDRLTAFAAGYIAGAASHVGCTGFHDFRLG
ncbi:MAG TPA: hypothetical protein VIM71_08510 [Lacunisphaera sp.]